MKTKLNVLYCPDYIPSEQRIQKQAALARELSLILWAYEIRLGWTEGPFEDTNGQPSFFDRDAFQSKQQPKRWLSIDRSLQS